MSARVTPESTPPQQALRSELLENAAVLVVETTYPKGGSVPLHEHRFPHVLYVIEGGTVQTTAPDGGVTTLDVRAGQVLWRDAQSHSTRNVGPTTVRIVEVEVKNAGAGVGGERTPRVATNTDRDWIRDPLDPRRSAALLVGNPTRPGPYTVRTRAEAGYAIGAHLHPTEDEHLTVLSGALHWSTGAAGSGAPEHVLPAGGYVVFPAGTPHRLWVTESTVLQMSGIGPRTYVYLDPTEDPRAKR
jgi:quercetin dioxygenase-like cupin family protein